MPPPARIVANPSWIARPPEVAPQQDVRTPLLLPPPIMCAGRRVCGVRGVAAGIQGAWEEAKVSQDRGCEKKIDHAGMSVHFLPLA